ncbi:MAG: gamma-glutamyltransferase family protein [Burkholderiales bacterium]|nr:gamma-glutamyltransferase family protein [Burkholderiales bacterium]
MRRAVPHAACLAACLFLAAGCAPLRSPVRSDPAVPALPEPAVALRPASAAAPAQPVPWAVATAHPLASEAGRDMLLAGGSAIDAAVAAQAVLALVEPQSSGMGGGAFLLHWDGAAVQAWDGRETAPVAAHGRQFLRDDGRPMAFDQATGSGLAVGVPGALRMLEAAHRQHGRLPWRRLFEPAVRLAEQGFAVSPRLAGLLRSPAGERLADDAQARAPYFPAGQPLRAGETLRNPALGAVLRRIAAQGAQALHEGPVAQAIVQRVAAAPHGGGMTATDLAGYRPVQREPLCAPWRRWVLCGFPPPGSGHLATMQILGLLDRVDAARPAVDAPPGLAEHRYAEAARLAFADRAAYVGDPAFVAPPTGDWAALVSPAYLDARARRIDDTRSQGVAPPGRPEAPADDGVPPGDEGSPPERGTSHLSIVDAQGRAVALTTTIEAAFGSRRLTDGGTGLPGGFLLNNQLTDFSFVPKDAEGRPAANRVQPGKRPRSSMSPTLVFDAGPAGTLGPLRAVTGSPGGAAIIHFNTRVLHGLLADGLSPLQAVNRPHLANDNGVTRLERGRFAPAVAEALRRRGHTVVEQDLTSGTQLLWRTEGGWLGAADPRREGVVLGPPVLAQPAASAEAASGTSAGPR